jgi:hypothetical protein
MFVFSFKFLCVLCIAIHLILFPRAKIYPRSRGRLRSIKIFVVRGSAALCSLRLLLHGGIFESDFLSRLYSTADE